MKRTKYAKLVALLVILFSGYAVANSFFINPFSEEKMKLLPVPVDYRNYFFLQSIDDDTHIIVGDFTGAEKLFSQVIDKGSNNEINKVVEYFPDSRKFKRRKSSSSKFVANIEDLKNDIITGKIFRETYSYKMTSLDTLEYKIKDGTDIFPYGVGYTVKFYDPDEPTTIMSEFFFAKRNDRYDLIFKTNYYKLYRMKIKPPIPYSVYCKNSKDPIVAKVVESLRKMIVQ